MRSPTCITSAILALGASLLPASAAVVEVDTVPELVSAVTNGVAGDTVRIAAGTYALSGPLLPKAGMRIQGAGMEQTRLVPAAGWNPGSTGLPEDPVNWETVNRGAYVFSLSQPHPGNGQFPAPGPNNVAITDLTVDGDNRIHGGLYMMIADGLRVERCRFRNLLWTGVRTFYGFDARVAHCIFENAGRYTASEGPGVIFFRWTRMEIAHNLMYYTGAFTSMGIKGRGCADSRIHHNTILLDFAIEIPFENDRNVEIDHNVLAGAISIPVEGGGDDLSPGYAYDIHHNWFHRSYSIEGTRNSVLVRDNLFDFNLREDQGNLVSTFTYGRVAGGPFSFTGNLVANPGYGLFWTAGGQNRLTFRNNHIRARRTIGSQGDGLFGLDGAMDHSTVTIADNIITCADVSRPLMRNTASYGAVIRNNTLSGITDTASFSNPSTDAVRGPLQPLVFTCGVDDAFQVRDWVVTDGRAAGAGSNPCTLFGAEVPPGLAVGDGAYELGTEFSSSLPGAVTRLRAYRGAGETGTTTGRLWTASGTLLATRVFPAATAPGWHEVALAAPIPIQAGTRYLVSANTTTAYGFTASGHLLTRRQGPLSLHSGAFSTSVGQIPFRGFLKATYGVDVVVAYAQPFRRVRISVVPQHRWQVAAPATAVLFDSIGATQDVESSAADALVLELIQASAN
jgi:hypothetical protein